jgi:nucleoid DNA-binding protein
MTSMYKKLLKYRKSVHLKIVKDVSKKTGYSPALINVTIATFFDSLRDMIKKGNNVKMKGLFSLIMKPSYRQTKVKKNTKKNLVKD